MKHERGRGVARIVGVVALADAPQGADHPSSQPVEGDILVGEPCPNARTNRRFQWILRRWRG
ncbi:hypothetical protein QOZ40_29000, partial [Pseudomonas aeruginosa]|uniref:hypothetical protein n=1 Tax=Pseudomonas aeruginosa TaxID=287 RepID=UPI00345A09E8